MYLQRVYHLCVTDSGAQNFIETIHMPFDVTVIRAKTLLLDRFAPKFAQTFHGASIHQIPSKLRDVSKMTGGPRNWLDLEGIHGSNMGAQPFMSLCWKMDKKGQKVFKAAHVELALVFEYDDLPKEAPVDEPTYEVSNTVLFLTFSSQL